MNDLSMHVLDILQNSISAESKLTWITVSKNTNTDLLTIEIKDSGKGMTPEQVSKLDDPFFTSRTTRRVGMGIPLLKLTANQSGGDIFISSELNVGTYLKATFGLSNIDRPPLGDIANAIILTVSSNPQLDFIFKYEYNDKTYTFNTIEIKEALDGLPINDTSIMLYLQEMIQENIAFIEHE